MDAPTMTAEIHRLRAELRACAKVERAGLPAGILALMLTIEDGGETAEHASLEDEHAWLRAHLQRVAAIDPSVLPPESAGVVERAQRSLDAAPG